MNTFLLNRKDKITLINNVSEPMKGLSCFKSYDVRGEIGVNIDEDIVYP